MICRRAQGQWHSQLSQKADIDIMRFEPEEEYPTAIVRILQEAEGSGYPARNGGPTDDTALNGAAVEIRGEKVEKARHKLTKARVGDAARHRAADRAERRIASPMAFITANGDELNETDQEMEVVWTARGVACARGEAARALHQVQDDMHVVAGEAGGLQTRTISVEAPG